MKKILLFIFILLSSQVYAQTILQTNVGIGSTNPSAALEVNGFVKIVVPYNTITEYANVENGPSGQPRYTGWYVTKDASTGNIRIVTRYQGNDYNALNVTNNGTGNVGIGTPNPRSQLEVWDPSSKSFDEYCQANWNGTLLYCNGNDKTSTNNHIEASWASMLWAVNQTSMSPGTTPTSNWDMVLTSTGLGIHNNSPAYALDVGGTVKATNFMAGSNIGISTTCPGGFTASFQVTGGLITHC